MKELNTFVTKLIRKQIFPIQEYDFQEHWVQVKQTTATKNTKNSTTQENPKNNTPNILIRKAGGNKISFKMLNMR